MPRSILLWLWMVRFFPQSPEVQLRLAIEAVFGSWNNPRAILYRKQNKISDDLGTAVNVQSMIFRQQGQDLRYRRCLYA